MGASLSGIHVRADSLDSVEPALAPLVGRGAAIVRSGPGWVSVFDAQTDREPGRLHDLTARLSQALGAIALGFRVTDSDRLDLSLAENGSDIDGLATGAEERPDRRRVREFAQRLASLANDPAPPKLSQRIEKELGARHRSEEERLAGINEILGMDPDLATHGYDSLMEAIDDGRVGEAARVIPAADMSAADRSLVEAIERADEPGIEAALAAGGDPNANAGGQSVLAFALHINYLSSVFRLLDAGAVPNLDDLIQAMNLRNDRLLTRMLEAGFDVASTHPSYGFTALYVAASLGYVEGIRILLGAGADIDQRFDLWEGAGGLKAVTALWGAKRPDAMEAMISAGASVDAADAFGVTPLMLTALGRHGGEHCWALMSMLLKAGADLDRRCEAGLTVDELLSLQIRVYEHALARDWERCLAVARELEDALGLEWDQAAEKELKKQLGRKRQVQAAVSAFRELSSMLERFKGG